MVFKTKFELDQQINIKWTDVVVTIKITKRLISFNPDTLKYTVYYDYRHDFSGGYTFTDIPEDYLYQQYKIALDEYIEKLVRQ